MERKIHKHYSLKKKKKKKRNPTFKKMWNTKGSRVKPCRLSNVLYFNLGVVFAF